MLILYYHSDIPIIENYHREVISLLCFNEKPFVMFLISVAYSFIFFTPSFKCFVFEVLFSLHSRLFRHHDRCFLPIPRFPSILPLSSVIISRIFLYSNCNSAEENFVLASMSFIIYFIFLKSDNLN